MDTGGPLGGFLGPLVQKVPGEGQGVGYLGGLSSHLPESSNLPEMSAQTQMPGARALTILAAQVRAVAWVSTSALTWF